MLNDIYPHEVEERLNKGEKLTIIDVREDDEVASGMIPGAKHIPLGQLTQRVGEIDRQKETILVCRSGNRSGRACEYLQFLGYQQVRNMVGGMLNWQGELQK